jgi:hypothetical protein
MTRNALEKQAGDLFDINLVKKHWEGMHTWPALVLEMIGRRGIQ